MERGISICGAGLVGSLLSIFLKNKGFRVRVFEKRQDPRIAGSVAGRSINLAISQRGLRALAEAYPGLDSNALELAVPMYGREIHDVDCNLKFQAYGEASQHINSIGRAALNELLISTAERLGVDFCFEYTCSEYDAVHKQWAFSGKSGQIIKTEKQEILIGADGAFSAVRSFLSKQKQEQPLIDTLDYGYKELEIYSENAKDLSNQEALHIWPRERFMLIALPNKDQSFTATLFLPLNGELSFEHLKTKQDISQFFNRHFPDALQLIPNLIEQFEAHPTSKLFTVHTSNWYNEHSLLIGDAAHALVPFYGQGMNAGFEDCRILSELIANLNTISWQEIFSEFYKQRKNNADAISDLALKNFVEMRDHVADVNFLLRKKIEKYLYDVMPNKFVPQYTLVSFTDTPYRDALDAGILHDNMFEEIMKIKGILNDWPNQYLEQEVVTVAQKYL